jgi:RNA polymerase sigma factor (sigma-70 family)
MGSLLSRIRSGDRQAAAEFVTRFEPQLRRRIRERLHRELRPVFDSQDIFSTLCRRFDMYVSKGHVKATSLGEIISLLQVMARSTMIDKARVTHTIQSLHDDDEDPDFIASIARMTEQTALGDFEATLERCSDILPCDSDRDILQFWMMGLPHNLIAETLGLEHASVRKRWQLIKERLRLELTRETP